MDTSRYKISARGPHGQAFPTYIRNAVTPGMAVFDVFKDYYRITEDGKILDHDSTVIGWIIEITNDSY